jgi:hypothetical protein
VFSAIEFKLSCHCMHFGKKPTDCRGGIDLKPCATSKFRGSEHETFDNVGDERPRKARESPN